MCVRVGGGRLASATSTTFMRPGSSVPVLTKEHCDEALMDFDDLKSRRSGLGTAAVPPPLSRSSRARASVPTNGLPLLTTSDCILLAAGDRHE